MTATARKIQRIRGDFAGLSPDWKPSAEQVEVARDPWARRLLYSAVACFAVAVLAFVVYKLVLGSGASNLHTIVS
jgi:type VI secretion system protein ImpK